MDVTRVLTRRSSRLVFLAAAVTVGAMILHTASSDAGSPDPRTPIASGQLQKADGSPAAQVEVTVAVLDESKPGYQLPVVLGTTHTDEGGRWSIASPDQVIRAGATLELQATIDGTVLIYDFPAFPEPPRNSRGEVVRVANAAEIPHRSLTLRARKGLVRSRGAPAIAARTGDSATSLLESDEEGLAAGPDEWVAGESASGPLDGPGGDGVPDAQRASTCPGPKLWMATNNYTKVWVPLKVGRTLGKSEMTYKWSSTTQTELGVAITGSEGRYSGGLSGSDVEETGMTITPDWPNHTSKLVRARWKYRQYQQWCAGGPPPAAPPRALNVYKWKAYRAEGFTRAEFNNPTFRCGTRGPVNAKLTLDRTAVVRWTGWFSIAGLRLDDTQTQSTSTATVIDPDKRQTPEYCGSGGSLYTSAFVREIP